MTLLLLTVTSFLAWIVSTLAGGGGALLMVPVITWLIDPKAVAPAISVGTLLSSPVRVWLFWKDVNWKIVAWYVPGAIVGAMVGGYIFAHVPPQWLKIVAALFLLSTIFQYRFGERKRSFPMRVWVFLPVALVVSAISGTIGEAGPVLNPFFINYGSLKEEMIATKSVNSLAMQLAKLGTYTAFGVMTPKLWLYGIVIGVAASAASWVAKHMLRRMEEKRFVQLVVAVMVITGGLMLWQERHTIVAALGTGRTGQNKTTAAQDVVALRRRGILN